MGLGRGQAEGISPSTMARKGDKEDGILVLALEGTFLQVDGGKDVGLSSESSTANS